MTKQYALDHHIYTELHFEDWTGDSPSVVIHYRSGEKDKRDILINKISEVFASMDWEIKNVKTF
jgi:hypothetical protein